MRPQLTQGSAGSLEFYPPEGVAPDGAVSVTVYSSGQSKISGTWPATASMDTASVTLSADTASDYTKTLATGDAVAAGFRVGRLYILETTDGRALQVEAEAYTTDSVTLRNPLSGLVRSGSVLRGYRCVLSLGATQTAQTQRALRAVFSYDVDSEPVSHAVFFDIVRQPYALRLTLDYMRSIAPSFGQNASEGWEAVAERVCGDCFGDLQAQGYQPDLIRDHEPIKRWAAWRLLVTLQADVMRKAGDQVGISSAGVLEHYQAQEAHAKHNVIDSPMLWYDRNDDMHGAPERECGDGTVYFEDSAVAWRDVSGSRSDSKERLPARRARIF